jgi:hypothetical protein
MQLTHVEVDPSADNAMENLGEKPAKPIRERLRVGWW